MIKKVPTPIPELHRKIIVDGMAKAAASDTKSLILSDEQLFQAVRESVVTELHSRGFKNPPELDEQDVVRRTFEAIHIILTDRKERFASKKQWN